MLFRNDMIGLVGKISIRFMNATVFTAPLCALLDLAA